MKTKTGTVEYQGVCKMTGERCGMPAATMNDSAREMLKAGHALKYIEVYEYVFNGSAWEMGKKVYG